jgi:hypothetical protein
MRLTMKERQKVTRKTAEQYRRAGRREKAKILDVFTQQTGYNRKYAVHILANVGKTKFCKIDGKTVAFTVTHKTPEKRVYKKYYDEPVAKMLAKIWAFFDFMYGKRPAPFMRENLGIISAHERFPMDENIKLKLKKISPATVDRLLKKPRKALSLKGTCTTKPGKLLRNMIPIRTHFAWDERKPGFLEIDTVSHDGGNASGDHCYTLSMTDVGTGWTEPFALRNNAQKWVIESMTAALSLFPFPIKGVDSDNGGEFINRFMFQWCNDKNIMFTRGRPYKKNDNCFVEQKNDAVVRRLVGYARFEGNEAAAALKAVYDAYRPLLNLFYPCTKIIAKERDGARIHKTYELPKTPFRRVLESPDVDDAAKTALIARKSEVNPVVQKLAVDAALDTLHAFLYSVPVLPKPIHSARRVP